MSTQSITPNNLKQAEKALHKVESYEVPTEIRADEAHLTHLIMVKSVPNMKTLEFNHTVKIVKLTEEALAATKDHYSRMGQTALVELHNGRKWKNEGGGATSEEKAPEAPAQDTTSKQTIEDLKKELEEERQKNAKLAEDAEKAKADAAEALKNKAPEAPVEDKKEPEAPEVIEEAAPAQDATETLAQKRKRLEEEKNK